MKPMLTIFTPVYNRAEKIQALKDSLKSQTNQEFVWLVVDDGSTDNTWEVLKEIAAENHSFEYHYFHQHNQGKHSAHNFAAQQCNTELFYCVDSDDLLPPDAVARIKNIWDNAEQDPELSGIVGLKAHYNYEIVGNRFPENIKKAALSELYSAYGKTGDTALIWKTDVIKKYPFKIFEGERFLRENTAYDRIDENYKLLVFNEILYLCEYYEDGLSANATQLEFKSPRGAAYYRLLEARKAKGLFARTAYYSGYVFFCRMAGNQREALQNLGLLRYILYTALSVLIVLRYRKRGIKIEKYNDAD